MVKLIFQQLIVFYFNIIKSDIFAEAYDKQNYTTEFSGKKSPFNIKSEKN